MRRRKKIKIYSWIVAFLYKCAFHPCRLFFALAAIFLLLSAIVFFDVRKIVNTPPIPNQISRNILFDDAAEERYYRALDIINQRAVNYEKARNALYPDVFALPSKGGVISNFSEKLTETEN